MALRTIFLLNFLAVAVLGASTPRSIEVSLQLSDLQSGDNAVETVPVDGQAHKLSDLFKIQRLFITVR